MLTEFVVVIVVHGRPGGLNVPVGVAELWPRGHLAPPARPRAPPRHHRPGLGLRHKLVCIFPEHGRLRHLGILCVNNAFKMLGFRMSNM